MNRVDTSGPVAAGGPTARSVLLVAVGQFSLMVFGGLLAVLIARSFGKTRETDAFFAAYAVYALGQVFASSLRLSVIPELVDDPDRVKVGRTLVAATIVAGILAAPLVVMAGPVADLLVGQDPGGVATFALRALWFAMAAQIVTSVLLAALSVERSYGAIAFVTGSAGIVSTGLFLVLERSLGVDAASVALAAAGSYMAIVAFVFTRRRGISSRLTRADDGWHPVREAGLLLWSSAAFFGPALAYLFAIAIAARQNQGDATVLSYAYVLASVLVAVTSYVLASLRSPHITANEERVLAALDATRIAVRVTVAFVTPLVFGLCVLGSPLLHLVLGSGFSDDDVRGILATLVALSGWMLATALGIFPTVELLARPARGTLAVLAGILTITTTALAMAGYAVAGTVGIASALSLAALLVAGFQVAAAFPGSARALLAEVLGWCGREAVIVAAALTPLLIAAAANASSNLVRFAALSAVGIMVALSAVSWPDERRLVLGVLGVSR
jgi:O-antigen/teichoic acid export membrane protein